MNDGQMFELSEDHAFTGRKTLGLKQNHIKFRGFYGDVSPIVVRNDQIEQFKEVLDFLGVWDWKPNYDPEDCGSLVLDGKSWSFTASLMNSNAKPAVLTPIHHCPMCSSHLALAQYWWTPAEFIIRLGGSHVNQ